MDLRERVIAACEAGVLSRSKIAEQFQISEGSLYNWLRRWRALRSFAPVARRGGRGSEVDGVLLKSLVEAQNDRTLAEYAEVYEQQTGRRYHPSHLSRMLIRLGISRKRRRYAPRNSSSRRSSPSA
jgi:transposase